MAYPITFIFSAGSAPVVFNGGALTRVDLTIQLTADTANLSKGAGYDGGDEYPGLTATVSSNALGLVNVSAATVLSVDIAYGTAKSTGGAGNKAVFLGAGGQYNGLWGGNNELGSWSEITSIGPLTLDGTATGTLSITLSTGQVLQIVDFGYVAPYSTFQATSQAPPQPGWFDPPNANPLLPTGQTITPAGAQVTFPGRPVAVAVHPLSPTAAFLVGESDGSVSQACFNGQTPASIILVDLTLNAVKQCYSPHGDNSAGLTGLLYNAAGTQLYASLSDGAVAIIPVQPDGTIDTSTTPTMIAVKGACPSGLALSTDQNTLYVALDCKNQIAAINLWLPVS